MASEGCRFGRSESPLSPTSTVRDFANTLVFKRLSWGLDHWTGAIAMSLLDHPDAQALLADATLTPETVEGCQERLTVFLQRYLPRFSRVEHRAHATTVLRGFLSGLERKTCEPIADQAGLHRKT